MTATASLAPRRALTTPAPPSGCPECGADKLTRLAMTLTDGSPVDFASCHACEWHGWAERGASLDLSTVLAKAQRRRGGGANSTQRRRGGGANSTQRRRGGGAKNTQRRR